MAFKDYRNRETGKLGSYDERMTHAFPGMLEEVSPLAKPLAYVRISEPAIDALRAAQTAGPDDETTIVTEASDLGPAPIPKRKAARRG